MLLERRFAPLGVTAFPRSRRGENHRQHEHQREKERDGEENDCHARQRVRALHRATVLHVARCARVHLRAIRGFNTLDAVQPPRAATKDVLADFTRADDLIVTGH
jgi:hypothetical protein